MKVKTERETRIDGVTYGAGETVEVEEALGKRLIDRGFVSVPRKPKEQSEASAARTARSSKKRTAERDTSEVRTPEDGEA